MIELTARRNGAQVELADGGQRSGVDADEMSNRIFEPGVRRDVLGGDGERRSPGAGLGLALARGASPAPPAARSRPRRATGGGRFVVRLPGI